MITVVIKRDGTEQPFNPAKLNKWAEYATKSGGSWSEIAMMTYKRLDGKVKASDIHTTMINVCLDKEDIKYSRIAARLEHALIRKNLDAHGIKDSGGFKSIYDFMIDNGIWCKETLPPYNPVWEEWYEYTYQRKLEYWQIKQWSDKYAAKLNGKVIETPQIGCIGIGLGLHGDSQLAFDTAKGIIDAKINLPTPALNGIRNGDFDGISCCVISGGDSIDSIGVAEHLAYKFTAKKAGIGIEFNTRSKGDGVKGGRVTHLGKHPIYATLDKAVKMFTQMTRGGSATVTFKCIDPEAEDIMLWKTQRVDIETRLDKLDYSFAYNHAFLEAVIKDKDWYLFSLVSGKEAHDKFYDKDSNLDSYIEMASRLPHTKVKARSVLKTFLTSRSESGRMYCFNVTRANTHTGFIDKITLSNL